MQMLHLAASVNTTIAIRGDWAGSAYNGPGTCADAVANSTNYDCTPLLPPLLRLGLVLTVTTGAQIMINYISVYQKA